MSLNILVPIGIAVLNLVLLGALGAKSEHRAVAYFRLTVICMLLWTLSILATELSQKESLVLFWSRLSFFFPVFMTISLHPFVFFFATTNASSKKRVIFPPIYPLLSKILIGLGFLFSILSFTPLILSSVTEGRSSFGPLQPVYSVYFLASYLFIGLLLIEAKKRLSGRIHEQLELILLGITTSAILAIISNLILPILHLKEIRYLGPLSLVVFLGCTGYSIIAHQLFDIRIIVRRTIVYALLLSLLFLSYSAIIFLFSTLIPSSKNSVPNFIAALIIGISYDPLRRWLQDRTERFLFKKEYVQQNVLKELGQKLNNVIGLDEALETLMQTLVKALHLQHAVTFVFQSGENKSTVIKRIKQLGYASSARLMLEEKDFTLQYFTKNSAMLIVDNLEEELEREQHLFKRNIKNSHTDEQVAFVRDHAIKKSVLKKLHYMDASVAVPLFIGTQPIGLILLSSKLSQEHFSREDISLIDLVGSQAVSSIQKARLFEGDQMKTEFVSIASHELLTPVSAIEGYLSMMLDEHLGTFDEQARQYLVRIYSSARRLSTLIKDLLSVSRLEAGRVKMELQSIDLNHSIEEAVDQLRFLAQDKGITIECEAPKSSLPPAYADPDRLMEVLINLIGNAIKYTPAGAVKIRINAKPALDLLSVEIQDSGLGMSKEQQAHLFEKFYRVYTEDTANITGTGLGLYITKSILEKMGGSIALKSSLGAGSTFTFTLPLFKVEQSTLT